MAASVRIEDEAFSDTRIELLGSLLGTSKFDALGRLAYLWRQCTAMGRHTLPESVVAQIVGVDDLVNAKLAVKTKTGVRIRGAKGRVEWLERCRESGRANGYLGAEFGKRGGRPRKTPVKPPGGDIENPLTVTAPVTVTAPTEKTKDRINRRPSLEEVRGYFSERGNGLDPEAFFAHYEANGWVQSNGQPIQKWKMAVITWEKNEAKYGSRRNGQPKRPHNREDELLAELRHAEGAP